MWRCVNCGANDLNGAVCTECGRPFEEALNEISRKVRGVRLRRPNTDRWFWRGAKIGFAIGLGLSLISVAIMVVTGLSGHRQIGEVGESVGVLLPMILVATIFLSMLFAAIFLVFGTVVKPIIVALFCSVERFEQEYGSSRK